jgi:hypothetical protein
LKLKLDELLSVSAFTFNLRRYNVAREEIARVEDEYKLNLTAAHNFDWDEDMVVGRGLHSSTFRLNVSTFCGIGGALTLIA